MRRAVIMIVYRRVTPQAGDKPCGRFGRSERTTPEKETRRNAEPGLESFREVGRLFESYIK